MCRAAQLMLYRSQEAVMFELISEKRRRSPHGDTLPIAISTVAHLLVMTAVVVIPLLYVTDRLPEVPAMMAFVAPAPPPPPPPPPAPAAAPTPAARPVATSAFAAPIEVPTDVAPETGIDRGFEGGAPGGVEGGVPGGVIGGIVGGLPGEIPPPPPPAPPAAPEAPRAPVRVGGGDLQAPALLYRAEPVYPDIAVRAHVEGVVILEAVVDREGRIEEVRVLRSLPLLDRAALDAVRQWRYSPLLLNGKPERFVLTVVVSFRLSDKSE
jgi:protein TonB